MCRPARMPVQSIDHFAIETAADHRQEDAAVGAAGVEPHRGTFGQRVGKRHGVALQMKIAGQQVGGAQRVNAYRHVGRRAVDDLGHGAVAACGHHGPQVPLGMPQLDQPSQSRQVFDHLGRQAHDVQPHHEIVDQLGASPRTGHRVGDDQHAIGDGGNETDPRRQGAHLWQR